LFTIALGERKSRDALIGLLTKSHLIRREVHSYSLLRPQVAMDILQTSSSATAHLHHCLPFQRVPAVLSSGYKVVHLQREPFILILVVEVERVAMLVGERGIAIVHTPPLHLRVEEHHEVIHPLPETLAQPLRTVEHEVIESIIA